MILLDTSIVSDGLKIRPDPHVQSWIDSIEPSDLWISSVTVAELEMGVELMDEGQKKMSLRAGVNQALDAFGGLCLPFDALAAREFGRIVAARRHAGRPIEALDAQIAAIAITTGFALATLNTKDFEGIDGLKLIDPSLIPDP
jgi:predicted nucleic acid-binding protein